MVPSWGVVLDMWKVEGYVGELGVFVTPPHWDRKRKNEEAKGGWKGGRVGRWGRGG